jgi:hypothetical protein
MREDGKRFPLVMLAVAVMMGGVHLLKVRNSVQRYDQRQLRFTRGARIRVAGGNNKVRSALFLLKENLLGSQDELCSTFM